MLFIRPNATGPGKLEISLVYVPFRAYSSPMSLTSKVIGLLLLAFSISSVTRVEAVDYSDTKSPTFKVEEIKGIKSELNLLLYKITIEDESNKVLLVNCWSGFNPPNCMRDGRFGFSSIVKTVPPSNVAPACVQEGFTRRYVTGYLLSTVDKAVSKPFSSEFLVVVRKTSFPELPQGCPNWRNDSDVGWNDSHRVFAMDEAGNSLEVPLKSYIDSSGSLPNSKSTVCFIDVGSSVPSNSLGSLATQVESFVQRFSSYPEYPSVMANSYISNNEELVKSARAYSNFYGKSFDLISLNSLPTCQASNLIEGSAQLAGFAAELSGSLANLSIKLAEIANERLQANAEAEAKAKAEAAAEAEARAKAEAKAKAETAKKRKTINCVKGELTKKVKAVKPKCPKGYKKK